MTTFRDIIARTRSRFEVWLNAGLPKVGVATGLGVTAWCIGAALGHLTTEAQIAGWGTAIAVISAELGKEFIVSLVERIQDDGLTEEAVARIVQEELDRGALSRTFIFFWNSSKSCRQRWNIF